MNKENDYYQNKRRKLDDSDSEHPRNSYDDSSDYWPESDTEDSMLFITKLYN
jgi:hypothetical protein